MALPFLIPYGLPFPHLRILQWNQTIKMKTTIAILFVVALAGCGAPALQVITNVYNPEDAAYIHEEGNAVIEGQGFLRTMVGEVRTCAGAKVYLIPVTEDSTERIYKLYGNINKGENSVNRVVDAPAQYYRDTRQTVCDAEGDFRFTGIPSGEYFVTTSIFWRVPQSTYYSSREGAHLMERIQITGSEEEHIRVLLH